MGYTVEPGKGQRARVRRHAELLIWTFDGRFKEFNNNRCNKNKSILAVIFATSWGSFSFLLSAVSVPSVPPN